MSTNQSQPQLGDNTVALCSAGCGSCRGQQATVWKHVGKHGHDSAGRITMGCLD
jgi:hypothetical protein